MNQTKNYLVTKSVSLIVVDYFVVMIVLQVQAVKKHYLVAVGVVIDCLLPSWKYSQWNYSELQPLLLAFAAFSFSSSWWCFSSSDSPGVAIEVVEGTDCKEHRYVAVAVVPDFVEGAHEAIELVEGPNSNVDQD